MQITRGGKEIELSREEMYHAYMELKREYLAYDVRYWLDDKMIDRFDLPSVDEMEYDGTVECAVDYIIDHHDSNMSHWQNVECAICSVLNLW